ncbi:hypothetical protein C8R44DRAFT_894003 [Mycena epipterygia]|nr:hypothetical protein C8R44DRAFT_894003 [Mycena epipterygia]
MARPQTHIMILHFILCDFTAHTVNTSINVPNCESVLTTVDAECSLGGWGRFRGVAFAFSVALACLAGGEFSGSLMVPKIGWALGIICVLIVYYIAE